MSYEDQKNEKKDEQCQIPTLISISDFNNSAAAIKNSNAAADNDDSSVAQEKSNSSDDPSDSAVANDNSNASRDPFLSRVDQEVETKKSKGHGPSCR